MQNVKAGLEVCLLCAKRPDGRLDTVYVQPPEWNAASENAWLTKVHTFKQWQKIQKNTPPNAENVEKMLIEKQRTSNIFLELGYRKQRTGKVALCD